jgi:hypothetical protein
MNSGYDHRAQASAVSSIIEMCFAPAAGGVAAQTAIGRGALVTRLLA